MKFTECLPIQIAESVCELCDLRELRIRNGSLIRVNVGGYWYFLGKNGLTQQSRGALTVDDVCDDIVMKACNNSVYAYEKMLAQGFFTMSDGVRVGVSGHIAHGKDIVFQKYTSLCFRIPHYVDCVDVETLRECERGNVVVIGPPCSGKTTFLRDLAVKLSRKNNVLVVDERGEFFYESDNVANGNCDVLKWTSKQYAFDIGIRAMSPQWIVCDELATADVPHIKSCLESGVNVACSAHGFGIEDFMRRFALQNEFSTAVVMSSENVTFKLKSLK